ncbi:MAG: hypothetical protein JO087_18695 [Actinobacteria bacterium]|nr:hypothetical protein [Actinomycetota bacterium]
MANRSALATWVRLWCACFVLWLVLTSTVVGNEVVTGIWAAALAAGATVVVLRHEPASRRTGTWPTARIFARVPLRIVGETGGLVRVLVHRMRGQQPRSRFEEIAIGPEVEGREALATILTSISPSQYVVGFDHARRVAVLHSLEPRGHASLDEALTGR